MVFNKSILTAGLALVLALSPIGCSKKDSGDGKGGSSNGGSNSITISGSDTIVNLTQKWAEEYKKIKPDVNIQVSGGGSGVGIASLISGTTDLANASRKIKEEEAKRVKEHHEGKEAVEHILALDALAVYVHNDNPVDSISIPELAEIYGNNAKFEKWSDAGIENPACSSGEITVVSRQNSSGTYAYFREAVLGKKRDFRLGTIDQSGSKSVIEFVSKNACAIGYSGMGYKTDHVKWLAISKEKGGQGVLPSVESAKSGDYPIARPLQTYSLGEPTGELKAFLEWCKGPAGQKIVLELGYVNVAPVE